MIDLIKKDFIASGIFLCVIAIMVPFLTAFSIYAMYDEIGRLDIGLFAIIAAILCLASSLVFTGIDAAFNADALFSSLPVKRSTIVCARYVSSFALVFSCLMIIITTGLFVTQVFYESDPAFRLLLSFKGIAALIGMILLNLSFLFPFIFKFGAGKGLGTALAAQLCLVLIVWTIRFFIKALKGILSLNTDFFAGLYRAFTAWITGLQATGMYFFIGLVMALSILVSIILSVRFYNRRDL